MTVTPKLPVARAICIICIICTIRLYSIRCYVPIIMNKREMNPSSKTALSFCRGISVGDKC